MVWLIKRIDYKKRWLATTNKTRFRPRNAILWSSVVGSVLYVPIDPLSAIIKV